MGPKTEDGHIAPTMLLGAVAIIALAFLLAPMAVGSTFRAGAQTAADAAAIAGAQELRNQLYRLDHTADADALDHVEICAAASDYAERNDAVVVPAGCAVTFDESFYVTVEVETADAVVIRPSQEPDPDDPDDDGDPGITRNPDATARAEVDPVRGGPMGGGPGGGWDVEQPGLRPDAPETVEERFISLVRYAQEISALNLPYVWGGGHQSSPAPYYGPFDCSGAVSAAMQHGAGYDLATAVSGQMTRIGRPGASPSGRGVTVYAYDGHVFMVIGGQGWGTGSSPNGGAGWLPYSGPYHSLFQHRHIPEFEELDPAWVDEVMREITGIEGPGDIPNNPGEGWGRGADIRLVPID